MNQEITPIQALECLDLATQPSNIQRLTRADFTNINLALQVLLDFVTNNNAEPVVDKTSKSKKTKEEVKE